MSLKLEKVKGKSERQTSTTGAEAKLETLEPCKYCGRLKTERHETYFFDEKSSYKRKVIICVDYVGETKFTHEKQLDKSNWQE